MFPFYNFVTRKLYNFVYFDFHMAVKTEIPAMKNLILLPSFTKDYRFKCGPYWTVKIRNKRQGLAGPARKVFFQKIREVLDGLFGANLDKQFGWRNEKVCANWTNEEKFCKEDP